jgi:hypothetical protein
MAEQLLDEATKALRGKDLSELEADKIVGIMEKAVKIQRISVGLSGVGNGDSAGGEPFKAASNEGIMRQAMEDRQLKPKTTQTEIDILQEDPDAIEKAQDLILQVSGARIAQNQDKNNV